MPTNDSDSSVIKARAASEPTLKSSRDRGLATSDNDDRQPQGAKELAARKFSFGDLVNFTEMDDSDDGDGESPR